MTFSCFFQSSVSSLQTDLDNTREAYNTLKSRAKVVATELKDRRVEVRTLSSQNEELTSLNTSLETQLTNLRAVIVQHELTIVYKDKDIEALNEKVKELEKELEGKDKSLQDRSAVGEKAIASYKRKAQEALAAANSRLAAANQAREEAESDAKAARSAADDAVERARIAEAKRLEAERSANDAANLIEAERKEKSKVLVELRETVDKLKKTTSTLQAEAEDAALAREKMIAEIERLGISLTQQKERNSDLHEKLIEKTTLCEALQKEVNDLQNEIQRSSAAAFKRAQCRSEATNSENSINLTSVGGSIRCNDRAESDGTIIMLQQELQGANEAIAELKLALRTALLERSESDALDQPTVGETVTSTMHGDIGGNDLGRGNDNTPLFFAIEKQNELNTARDEINRLANMLGDAECAKQEAYEAMEEMRQKMEEANSRLLRYEKLGMMSMRPLHTANTPASYGPFRNVGYSTGSYADGYNYGRSMASGNDSVVNLEYLKNVMLSFLKAKTLADRRKLVPVIATVLCLTPEEQAQAVDCVEQSAGLTGVASSFWENLESKAHKLI